MNEQRPAITKLEALRTLMQETQTRTDHNWWHGDDFAAPLQLVEEALAEANKESVVVFPGIQVTSVGSGGCNPYPSSWQNTWVGEYGPELMVLPKGAYINPLSFEISINDVPLKSPEQ